MDKDTMPTAVLEKQKFVDTEVDHFDDQRHRTDTKTLCILASTRGSSPSSANMMATARCMLSFYRVRRLQEAHARGHRPEA
jgi:hypothetical protein